MVDPMLRYFVGEVERQDSQLPVSLFTGGQWMRGTLVSHVVFFDGLSEAMGASISDPGIAESWRTQLRLAGTVLRARIDQALADEHAADTPAPVPLGTILNLRDASVYDASGQWQAVGYWRVDGDAVASWSMGW
jgi:hypothetical protein